MRKKRGFAAAVQLDENKWMVTGGYDGENELNSTEVYDASSDEFSDYMELPETTYDHCILNYNQTHLLLITGANSYLFNR